MAAASLPDITTLAPVIDGLGTHAFGPALLAWLTPALKAAHLSAFRFDAGLQARVVLAADAGSGGSVARQSAEVYLGTGLYRHDRLRGVLGGADAGRRGSSALGALEAGGGPEGPAVLRTRRADIGSGAYGASLWDRFGLVDRLSVVGHLDGQWTALNLYRDAAGGPFKPDHCHRLRRLAPLLLSLLGRHLAVLQPAPRGRPDGDGAIRLQPEAAGALLLRLPVRLSGREREVCALALAGHTRQGIALALGIAPSSVATLRARAWRKLDIHSASELFALCLQHAAGPAST